MGLLPTVSALCAGLDAPGRHADAPMSLSGQRRAVVRSVLGGEEEVAVEAQEVAPGRPQYSEVSRPRVGLFPGHALPICDEGGDRLDHPVAEGVLAQVGVEQRKYA